MYLKQIYCHDLNLLLVLGEREEKGEKGKRDRDRDSDRQGRK
jgi:hypothetical protein